MIELFVTLAWATISVSEFNGSKELNFVSPLRRSTRTKLEEILGKHDPCSHETQPMNRYRSREFVETRGIQLHANLLWKLSLFNCQEFSPCHMNVNEGGYFASMRSETELALHLPDL